MSPPSVPREGPTYKWKVHAKVDSVIRQRLNSVNKWKEVNQNPIDESKTRQGWARALATATEVGRAFALSNGQRRIRFTDSVCSTWDKTTQRSKVLCNSNGACLKHHAAAGWRTAIMSCLKTVSGEMTCSIHCCFVSYVHDHCATLMTNGPGITV